MTEEELVKGWFRELFGAKIEVNFLGRDTRTRKLLGFLMPLRGFAVELDRKWLAGKIDLSPTAARAVTKRLILARVRSYGETILRIVEEAEKLKDV